MRVGGGSNLQNSYYSSGTPIVTIEADGNFGNVAVFKADYNKDEIDWKILDHAQRAGYLGFTFNTRGLMSFYVRVLLVSQTGDVTVLKWIRFDNRLAVPDRYEGQEEMATPYISNSDKNFHIANINIKKAVNDTFGQGGWEFSKLLIFRVRGGVCIKSVIFSK